MSALHAIKAIEKAAKNREGDDAFELTIWFRSGSRLSGALLEANTYFVRLDLKGKEIYIDLNAIEAVAPKWL